MLKEAIETILEVAEYKNAGLISAIVVTGCLAERYQDEIIKEMPEVDAVIGIGGNKDIVKACQKALMGIETTTFPNKCYLPLDDERMLSTPSHWAYLKIAEDATTDAHIVQSRAFAANSVQGLWSPLLTRLKCLRKRELRKLF